jgi:hypothetical protein
MARVGQHWEYGLDQHKPVEADWPTVTNCGPNAKQEDPPLEGAARTAPTRKCEFDYAPGGEQALDYAAKSAWTIASIKNDWATVDGD